MEKKIAEYVKKYGISREEAVAMIEYDNKTDKMTDKEIKAELTPEQRAAEKKMRITTSGEKKERKVPERKPNEAKRSIISLLVSALAVFTKPIISNPERQIDFVHEGVEYSVTLTAHRKKKEG